MLYFISALKFESDLRRAEYDVLQVDWHNIFIAVLVG